MKSFKVENQEGLKVDFELLSVNKACGRVSQCFSTVLF